jgi:hypothetical protein
MRQFCKILFFIALVFGISSGHTTQSTSENHRVIHVVVCWLKNPKDMQARKDLIETSKTFTTIPGVVEVRAGEVLPSTRPMVDSSFDIAVAIYFKDEQSLRDYDNHPIHQKAVQEKLLPLVEKFIIYDFVEE